MSSPVDMTRRSRPPNHISIEEDGLTDYYYRLDLDAVYKSLKLVKKPTVEEYLYGASFQWGHGATTHATRQAIVHYISAFLDRHDITFDAPSTPYSSASWELTSRQGIIETQRFWTQLVSTVNRKWHHAASEPRVEDLTDYPPTAPIPTDPVELVNPTPLASKLGHPANGTNGLKVAA